MKLLYTLRALLVVPFALLLTLFISIMALLWTLVLRRDANSVQGLAAWWAKSICAASGVVVSVTGTEKLDAEKPYIFAANHQSQFDIFACRDFWESISAGLPKRNFFRFPYGAMPCAGRDIFQLTGPMADRP